jgi:RNA polymerase sigma-70 factor (ECF subfamily)
VSKSGSQTAASRTELAPAFEPVSNRRIATDRCGAAIHSLFARHRRVLYYYFLHRTGQRSDAEDLVQDVFVRLSRMESFEEIRNAEAFLFETASNLLKDWARRRRTHGVTVEPIEAYCELWDREPGPERVIQARAELCAVVQALDGLGEKTRHIFILRRLERVKCQEIAALYGISVKAVERHIAKALLHLSRTIART